MKTRDTTYGELIIIVVLAIGGGMGGGHRGTVPPRTGKEEAPTAQCPPPLKSGNDTLTLYTYFMLKSKIDFVFVTWNVIFTLPP